MPQVPRHSHSRSSHGLRTRKTHDYDAMQEGLGGGEAAAEQWGRDAVVGPGQLMPGVVASAAFAAGIRPVGIVSTLPTLPSPDYPLLSYVVLTTDSRLYKNIGNVWVKGVDGADIVADTITAGQIAAGAIGASEMAIGALPSRNLLKNGGFRNGLTDWTFQANGVAGATAGMWSSSLTDWTLADGDVDNWVAATGPYGSTAYIHTGVMAGAGEPYLQSAAFPVSGGEYYSASALLGCQRLTAARIALWFWDSAGVFISGVNSSGANMALPGGPDRTTWNYMTISGAQAPTNARYGQLVLVMTGPTTSGVDSYLFMDQCWVGAGLIPRPYDPAEAYAARNSTGRVLIDGNGITIQNGALTIQDEFASTVAQGSGFSGGWSDYAQTNLYNSSMKSGVAGAIPAGRTTSLPYWTVAYTNASATFAFASLAISIGATTGVATFTSDMVRVVSGGRIQINARYNVQAGNAVLRLKLIEYSAAGGASAAQTVHTSTLTGTRLVHSKTIQLQDTTTDVQVIIDVTNTSGLSDTVNLLGFSIAKVDGLVVPVTQSLGAAATLTTTPTSLGFTIPHSVDRGYLITATVDFDITVAGVGVCVASLMVNGGAQTDQLIFGTASTGRTTISRTWYIPAGTPTASGVFDIWVSKTINAGTAQARNGHTTLLVQPVY